jgi:hypothetical protein
MTAIARAGVACAAAVIDPKQTPAQHFGSRWPEDKLGGFIVRAASSPAMTNVAGWAQELARSVVADFLVGLGPASAGAELFDQALSLAFNRNGSIHLPHFVAEFGNAGFVAEGEPIPVHQGALADPDILKPHKLGAIAILSREMITSSNAEELVGDVMVRGAGRMLDEVLSMPTRVMRRGRKACATAWR